MSYRMVIAGVGMTLGLALILAWTPAGAQQQQPFGQAPAPAAKREWRIVPLKYANATDLANVLGKMFGGGGRTNAANAGREATVAVDARTNSILVAAPAAELDGIEAMVKAMDVEGHGAARQKYDNVQIFQLRHLVPDEYVERALAVALLGQNANFAVDRQRKMVVMSGERDLLAAAEALLTRLDASPEKASSAEMRVRLVWLVTGNPPEGAGKPPADMADVVAELAKLGIEKPWLVAQAIVNATANQQFQLDGTASLDAPCQLTISGVLGDGGPNPSMQIDILATKDDPQAPPGGQFRTARTKQLCKLRTNITTPLGQSVVLGVTPTDGLTSVFVVQVLKK